MLEAQTAIPKASDLEKDVPTKISLADALNEAAIALDNFPKFDDMPFWKIAAILMSLGLSLFMFAIEETIVSTSVSAIGSAVNAKGSLSWITTSYLLTTTVFQPISGRAADAFGTKRLLIGSLWVFIIGMIITGTSQDLTQLVAGRFIAGAGGAGLLSYPCILISQLTNERQRSSYMNLINVTFIVGDALGPILGGAMARSGNWRWIFLFTPPLGPIVTLMLFRYLHIPRSPFHVSSFREALKLVDFTGMFFLVASLSFLVVALNLGGQSIPWSSPSIIGILCAAVVSLVAFVIAEFYAELPVAPVNLFSQWKWRNVPIMLVTRTSLFFPPFAISFYLPVFLQVTGISNIAAAALVIPFLLCAGIASTIANEIVTRYGHTRPVFLGALATLPVALGLMATLDETSSLGRIVGYSILAGCSFGPGTQLTMVIAQVGLPSHVLATVTALVGSSPTLGGVLGVGIVGSIINNAFRHSLSHSTVADFSNLNLNDVVQSVLATPAGLVRDTMIKAYISAWRAGFLALAGITAAQFLLCLMLRPIELDDGATQEKPVDGTQQERPTDEPKAAEDAARTV